MTGKELIIYILENNLENDKILYTVDELALKYGVGSETVKAWISLGYFVGIQLSNEYYVSAALVKVLKGVV